MPAKQNALKNKKFASVEDAKLYLEAMRDVGQDILQNEFMESISNLHLDDEATDQLLPMPVTPRSTIQSRCISRRSDRFRF